MSEAPRQGRPTAVNAAIVVAEPNRTCCGHYARALDPAGKLRLLLIGTRRGIAGVDRRRTRLNPAIGLVNAVGARLLPAYRSESLRFRLLPWFDSWARRHLQPGDHVLSSFGYANECFRFARAHGGKTFLDAGNSHPAHYWELLSEEHQRWNCPYPPFARHWYERSLAMLRDGVDYVLAPSSYVSSSFLDRGYKSDQIFRNMYPVDLSLFQPATEPRPAKRPLTIINTGNISLRKGTPYLLEAFRLVQRQHPSARLLLNRYIREDIVPVLARYRDLPIEWSPGLPHQLLAERLRSADVFVLPSIEEGLVQTALEAMACGVQVVLTPNTGTSDFVEPGVNGEIVPIRDAAATADAILKCAERARRGPPPNVQELQRRVSVETFSQTFLGQLSAIGLT